MRKFLLAGALAAALVATPALAQTNSNFTGTHVELQTGTATHNSVTYSAATGYDFGLGSNATIGVDADTSNTFDSNGRTIGAGAKIGYAFSPRILGYGRVGYANLDTGNHNLNGVAAGAGQVRRRS